MNMLASLNAAEIPYVNGSPLIKQEKIANSTVIAVKLLLTFAAHVFLVSKPVEM